MSTLHDRLSDLADEVEVTPVPAKREDLWAAGRREHRRHRAGAALLGVAAVILVVGLGLIGRTSTIDKTVPPADVPLGDLHLPKTVYPPSRWAPGTHEAGPVGPVAAIGMSLRARPEGISGVHEGEAVFAVSAVDGSARWLDLPEVGVDAIGNGWVALSPDGTKVGYSVGPHVVGQQTAIEGWAVYDTVTGETVQLRDPDQPSIVGAAVFEIQFSGDSRYLETDYSLTGSGSYRDNQLVVWDVESGQRIVAEGTGFYWSPQVGSAPSGIVWSRKADTFTYDPKTGATTTRTASTDRLVEWSDGPGGLSAYIDRGVRNKDPWRLFSGDGVELGHDLEVQNLVGWRDDTTVVVQRGTRKVLYVDVNSGETVDSEQLENAGNENGFSTNLTYAADLWANAMVDGVRPPAFDDPRVGVSDILRVVGPAFVVGLVGWFLWRRRGRP